MHEVQLIIIWQANKDLKNKSILFLYGVCADIVCIVIPSYKIVIKLMLIEFKRTYSYVFLYIDPPTYENYMLRLFLRWSGHELTQRLQNVQTFNFI